MVSKENAFIFLSSGRSLNTRTSEIYLVRLSLFTQLGLIATITKAALTVAVNRMLVVDCSARSMEEALSAMPRQNLFVLGIEFAVSYVFGVIIQFAIIQVVAEFHTQKPSTLRRSLTAALDRLPFTTFGFGLIYAVSSNIVGIGYNYDLCFLISLIAANTNKVPLPLIGVAMISFGVYAFPFVTLILPIVAIEKHSPRSAIKRACELVRRYRWYIYNSMYFPIFLTVLLSPILYAIIIGLFRVFGMAPFVAGVVGIMYVPLQTVNMTIVYFSIRVDREDLNMETLLKDLCQDRKGDDACEQSLRLLAEV